MASAAAQYFLSYSDPRGTALPEAQHPWGTVILEAQQPREHGKLRQRDSGSEALLAESGEGV